MLTPQFKLTQSETHLILTLRLPYLKITSCEFYIESHNFKFYLKPYLLSLNFQQKLKEVEQPTKAVYYHEKYLLEVWLQKEVQGEVFEGLGLLGKFLGSKSKGTEKDRNKGKKNLIQVIGQSPQIIKNETSTTSHIPNPFSYGFSHNYTTIFQTLTEQAHQLFSFNPEEVPIQDRHQLAHQITLKNFDQQAYLYDKYENEELQGILKDKEFQDTIAKMMSKFTGKQPLGYQQFKRNIKLANKQLLIYKGQQSNIMKQIVSLAFCYLYELCCMSGQMSVQSPRTINLTSGTLNCCLEYSSVTLQEVVKDTITRCLTYSLYKSLPLCSKVLTYLTCNLTQNFLCTFLADLRSMFHNSQPRYLLNKIYLDDFLLYCMKEKLEEPIEQVRKELGGFLFSQEEDVGIFIIQQEEEEEEEDQKKQVEERGQNGQEETELKKELPVPKPKIIQLSQQPSKFVPQPILK